MSVREKILNGTYKNTSTNNDNSVRNQILNGTYSNDTVLNFNSDYYLKQYQNEFEESEKAKGGLYNALLGGNIFAEKSFRDNSETYKKYLRLPDRCMIIK